jgi:hypothetical protein
VNQAKKRVRYYGEKATKRRIKREMQYKEGRYGMCV